MAGYCENCGCKIRSGYCTNCQEDAYIAFVQAPDYEFSKEFMEKAWEQEKDSHKKDRNNDQYKNCTDKSHAG